MAALLTTEAFAQDATPAIEEPAPPPPSPPPPPPPAPSITPVPVVLPPQRQPFKVVVTAEGGFLDPIYNRQSFGDNATRFDYRREGQQRNLYFYSRWSAELTLVERHHVLLLYQPLEIESTFVPERDIVERGGTLPARRPARATYGFPFYRFSYAYDLLPARDSELSIGFTGQIRNARTTLEALDGSVALTTGDVGFVPALKVRGRHDWRSGLWAGFELDGVYAPISVINGSSNDTTGAILDANARVGLVVDPRIDTFLNVRYLGGGATREGAGADSAKNWLHFVFVGIGASLELTRPHPRP